MITLEVPDEITQAMRLPEDEQKARLILELACSLYSQNLLSAGKAAQLAGMTRTRLGEELTKRNIARHYKEEDLAEDIAYAGV